MGLDFRMDLCWIGSNLSLVVFLFIFWGGGGVGDTDWVLIDLV